MMYAPEMGQQVQLVNLQANQHQFFNGLNIPHHPHYVPQEQQPQVVPMLRGGHSQEIPTIYLQNLDSDMQVYQHPNMPILPLQ